MFVARFRESNFLEVRGFLRLPDFCGLLCRRLFRFRCCSNKQVDYVTYMALQSVSSFASLVALPLWGKHADLVGNVYSSG